MFILLLKVKEKVVGAFYFKLTTQKKSLFIFFYSFIYFSIGSLFGPFISLPKDIQDRALEFLYYVDSGSEKIAKALSECKTRQQEISV